MARRQVRPCFGRPETATASDPMPLPKTATLAQLLPMVPVEICRLVGEADAWAGHLPRCNGPGLLGGQESGHGERCRGQEPSLAFGAATRVGPAGHQQLPRLPRPACGWREQAKLLLPAPAVSHLAVPVNPAIQPGLDRAARRLPAVPDSLSRWLVVRERLSHLQFPSEMDQRLRFLKGWDSAVGTQHLGDWDPAGSELGARTESPPCLPPAPCPDKTWVPCTGLGKAVLNPNSCPQNKLFTPSTDPVSEQQTAQAGR